MISRLTAYAACFAILSAATIVFGASTQARPDGAVATPVADAVPVVQLPRVEIIGPRLPR